MKVVIFNAEDFGYWKNRTFNYLLSQGHALWEIVQEVYVIPNTLNHVTQGELQRYENNYKALNLITTARGRNVYYRVAHLETAHDVWLNCATHMRALLRLSLHVETPIIDNTRPFLKNLESLDDCFARFESIVSSLRSCGPLSYSDNEYAKQLLYALDNSVWGMKIVA
jgi:hypothetical protein